MPPGAPYHGFIRPYSIRVDEFTTPSDNPVFVQPALYLLTHTHSDHLTGLAAKSFASRVWCSHDAKEMLLRLEPYKERKLKDSDIREDKKLAKAYQHLKVSPQVVDGRQDYHGSRDLLHAVSLNTLIPYDLSGLATVKITLLDANHCPGAVM